MHFSGAHITFKQPLLDIPGQVVHVHRVAANEDNAILGKGDLEYFFFSCIGRSPVLSKKEEGRDKEKEKYIQAGWLFTK